MIQRERNNPGRTRLAQFDLDGKPTGKLPVDLSLQGGVRKGISVSAEGVLYWSAEHDPSSEVRRLALLGGK